jgi:glutaconyl-CoA/methylmalonyl-CoA decarboxylase subunit gamma
MKKYEFTINGNTYNVKINSFEDGVAGVVVNGTQYEVMLNKDIKLPKTPKLVRSQPPQTPQKSFAPAPGLKKVTAPLPGIIHKLMVKEGDVIKPGDVLLVLEAMKMENNILAEAGGTVKSIRVKDGDSVLQGDAIMDIE